MRKDGLNGYREAVSYICNLSKPDMISKTLCSWIS